jgi:hypothetical protein
MSPFSTFTRSTRYHGSHGWCPTTGTRSRIRYFARDGEICWRCAKRNAKDPRIDPWDWNAVIGHTYESVIPGVPHECVDTCTHEETS